MSRCILFLSLILLYTTFSCTLNNTPEYYNIRGFTQGTSYSITYETKDSLDLSEEIDSLLKKFDMSLSTYEPASVISKINRNESAEVDPWFAEVFRIAKEVYRKSDGAFDITVLPLVNVWGFGPGERKDINQDLIDSLLIFVGMDKIRLEEGRIKKEDPRVMLDVNAIAQGYSVDVVADYLEKQGIRNYMVEIGGEIKTQGVNPEQNIWRIGVDRPEFGNDIPGRDLTLIIQLHNRSIATSGNYRNFYEEGGVKYAHSINPKTGYPVKHQLLSASIVADDCVRADAWATACMVSGLEKSIEMLKSFDEVEGYLIYNDDKGLYRSFYTPGFEPYIYKRIDSTQ